MASSLRGGQCADRHFSAHIPGHLLAQINISLRKCHFQLCRSERIHIMPTQKKTLIVSNPSQPPMNSP